MHLKTCRFGVSFVVACQVGLLGCSASDPTRWDEESSDLNDEADEEPLVGGELGLEPASAGDLLPPTDLGPDGQLPDTAAGPTLVPKINNLASNSLAHERGAIEICFDAFSRCCSGSIINNQRGIAPFAAGLLVRSCWHYCRQPVRVVGRQAALLARSIGRHVDRHSHTRMNSVARYLQSPN